MSDVTGSRPGGSAPGSPAPGSTGSVPADPPDTAAGEEVGTDTDEARHSRHRRPSRDASRRPGGSRRRPPPPQRDPVRRPVPGGSEGEARRAAKRERYLEAASEAIRRRGPAVSMEEIASACGVTKPILYRHFGDRSGLVNALAQRFAENLFTELDEALTASSSPHVLLSTTIDAYLRLLEREPELYQFVTQRAPGYQPLDTSTMVGDFQREVGRRVAVVMGEKMREANMDSGGVEPIAQGIVGLVHSAGDWWIERRSMPRARLVTYISELVWQGLSGMAAAVEAGTGRSNPG